MVDAASIGARGRAGRASGVRARGTRGDGDIVDRRLLVVVPNAKIHRRRNTSLVGARGMAEEEQIVKAPPEAVKKGGYCFIRGNPCRLEVCEVLPKATANGNKRLHLKGPHVFTGKSYEDTLNLTAGFHGIDVPVTVKAQYSLLDADPDTGFLSLLTDSGDCKEDVGLARGEDGAFDDLGKEVIRRFEAGEALRLTVLSLMGKDVVIACDADAGA